MAIHSRNSRYVPACLGAISAKKRKSAKQQVKEERQKVIDELRAAMINKKREIPKEWERGFLAAMSCIEQMR